MGNRRGNYKMDRKVLRLSVFVISAFLLLGVLFIAGCGEKPECKVKADCPGKLCKITAGCEKAKCKYTEIDKCCGNGKCEDKANENFCSCDKDCKAIPANKTRTMNYVCNEDNTEYKLGIDPKSANSETTSSDLSFSGFTASTKLTSKNPFNADQDMFKLEFVLFKKNDGVTKPTIKRIEVKAEINGNEIVLSEKDLGQVLWTDKNALEVELPVAGLLKDGEEQAVKGVNFLIDYEYTQGSGAAAKVKTGTAKYKLDKTIIFVNPAFTRKCPASCDDKNPCTEDSCSKDTNYFCYHKYKTRCPSNGMCETGENRCNAPKDCGYCEGDVSQFLEMSCTEDDECMYSVKDGVTEQVTKLDSFDFGPGKMNTEIKYDKPFKAGKSELQATVTLADITEAEFAAPLEIVEFRALEGNTQLGKTTVGEEMKQLGDETMQSFTVDTAGLTPEFRKSITLEIDYRYKSKSGAPPKEVIKESGLMTRKISLGDITFANTGAVTQ